MEPALEIGDLVQLKSGGPVMTVVECLSSGSVRCAWFNGDCNSWVCVQETFPVTALEDATKHKAEDED